MDNQKFYEALDAVMSAERPRDSIGTYGEKTVHAVLKNYFEPYPDSQETKIGGYVADIVGEDGIIEIQTGDFSRLRKKLDAFLEVSQVTVVYPIARHKWIIPIDPETGEQGKRRKSPKIGQPWDVFPELYKIKPCLASENFRLCIVMLDVDEYRRPSDEDGKGRRRGYVRYDRIPLDLVDEIHINCTADWNFFLPDNLPDRFTSADFGSKNGAGARYSSLMLNILAAAGAVRIIGKRGSRYVYEKVIP